MKKKHTISRSENMSRIKSKNTSIERLLGKAMWTIGLRYRKQCKDIFGNPDFCFRKKKIAIFCDSEFWHGKQLLEKKYIPKTNTSYWFKKISRNIERDKEVNLKLLQEGWRVLRYWQIDIEKNIEQCLEKIVYEYNK